MLTSGVQDILKWSKPGVFLSPKSHFPTDINDYRQSDVKEKSFYELNSCFRIYIVSLSYLHRAFDASVDFIRYFSEEQ